MSGLEVLYYVLAAGIFIIIIILIFIAFLLARLLVSLRKVIENVANIVLDTDILKNKFLSTGFGIISFILSLILRERR